MSDPSRRTKLFRLFSDREYRRSYVESFLNASIAAQIKANRERRGLSQVELAAIAGMKQSRISALEDVNYESWSIKTLKRLADAFDVALIVRFEPFSVAISHIDNISRESLEASPYNEEKRLGATARTVVQRARVSWATYAAPESAEPAKGAPAVTYVELG